MTRVFRTLLPVLLAATAAAPAAAQSRVTFRERGAKGPQAVTGMIEGESLAGIRIANRTIPAADVLDVNYDVPGSIKLDYPRAVAAESRSPAEAVAAYQELARTPAVQNNRALRRHIEYRVAMLTAARADESPEQYQKAVAALTKFRRDHPDAWQAVPATRALVRLDLDKQPPDYEAARKAYDELAATPGAPADVKQECAFAAIDLLLLAGKQAEAKQKVAALPAD